MGGILKSVLQGLLIAAAMVTVAVLLVGLNMGVIPFILVTIGVFAAILLVVMFMAGRRVPPGEVWTVERLGRSMRALQPGFYLVLPFIDLIGQRFSTAEVALSIPQQGVTTADGVPVTVAGTVYYRVQDAMKAAYQVQDLPNMLTKLAMTQFRAEVGRTNYDRYASRTEAEYRLLETLGNAAYPLGVNLKGVALRIEDTVER